MNTWDFNKKLNVWKNVQPILESGTKERKRIIPSGDSSTRVRFVQVPGFCLTFCFKTNYLLYLLFSFQVFIIHFFLSPTFTLMSHLGFRRVKSIIVISVVSVSLYSTSL